MSTPEEARKFIPDPDSEFNYTRESSRGSNRETGSISSAQAPQMQLPAPSVLSSSAPNMALSNTSVLSQMGAFGALAGGVPAAPAQQSPLSQLLLAIGATAASRQQQAELTSALAQQLAQGGPVSGGHQGGGAGPLLVQLAALQQQQQQQQSSPFAAQLPPYGPQQTSGPSMNPASVVGAANHSLLAALGLGGLGRPASDKQATTPSLESLLASLNNR
jgi:hypothetical protein